MASAVRCPICDARDRAFYSVPNNEIVLLCFECSSVWIDPDRVGWGDESTEQALCDHFCVTDSEQLFDPHMTGRTARCDVLRDPKWRAALDRIGRARPEPAVPSHPPDCSQRSGTG
ncbi:hypothetical protein psal_cds_751 [Pandoravirus salinus]|uniref:Uncharacterized protein n=1 Tax=Pandoravirus salinus TaxID=1349410 RepID=S4W2J8_9VIRU|nr:hypothetical protein psal_cds_751 [Pandoravirus salinus]AGO84737.1 hypothetical protein psal_cds_751 [Pandoravirus salinus]